MLQLVCSNWCYGVVVLCDASDIHSARYCITLTIFKTFVTTTRCQFFDCFFLISRVYSALFYSSFVTFWMFVLHLFYVDLSAVMFNVVTDVDYAGARPPQHHQAVRLLREKGQLLHGRWKSRRWVVPTCPSPAHCNTSWTAEDYREEHRLCYATLC